VSASPASWLFGVNPAIHPAVWLKVASVCFIVSGVVLSFRMRLRSLRERVQLITATRRAERECIARDLHDTLLQDIQALLFRLQAWAVNPALPLTQREEISDVAEQARRIVIEGRDRIASMRRGAVGQPELLSSLLSLGPDACDENAPRFELELRGQPRGLTPETRETLLDIAREAVRNALRHARANRIEINLEYTKRGLSLIVADDGCGIRAAAAGMSRGQSHFGVLGMQERAIQLGARFRIGTHGRKGCRVELTVPASRAFVETPRPALSVRG
jgi:signal transduction histidine kinase